MSYVTLIIHQIDIDVIDIIHDHLIYFFFLLNTLLGIYYDELVIKYLLLSCLLLIIATSYGCFF